MIFKNRFQKKSAFRVGYVFICHDLKFEGGLPEVKVRLLTMKHQGATTSTGKVRAASDFPCLIIDQP